MAPELISLMSVQAEVTEISWFATYYQSDAHLPVPAFVDVSSDMCRVKPPVFTVRSITLQSSGLEPPPNSSLVQAEILRRLLGCQRGRACQKCLNNGHHFTFAAELGETVRCGF